MYDHRKNSFNHHQPVSGILLHDDCGPTETEPDNVYRVHSYWGDLRGECVGSVVIVVHRHILRGQFGFR